LFPGSEDRFTEYSRMKFASYLHEGKTRVGIVDGPKLVDPLSIEQQQAGALGPDVQCFSTMQEVIAKQELAIPLAKKALEISRRTGAGSIDLGGAQLAAPIMPTTILCAGSNYLSHNAEKASSDTSGKEP